MLELGRGLPSRWCHGRQETEEALPREGLETVDRDSSFLVSKTSFTACEREL